MRNLLIVTLVVTILALPIMTFAMPDGNATATAGASVTIEQIPLSLSEFQSLEFGTIIPASTDSSVTWYYDGSFGWNIQTTGSPILADDFHGFP